MHLFTQIFSIPFGGFFEFVLRLKGHGAMIFAIALRIFLASLSFCYYHLGSLSILVTLDQ